MKTFTGLLSLAIVSGGLIASVPARADTYFRDTDRVMLRSYATTTTTDNAGNAVTTTYYAPGTVLPNTVTYTVLPPKVTTKLMAPPKGDEYAVINGNANLIDHNKRIVIDAEKLGDVD